MVDGHPLERVAGVFGQLAERQPMTVAVALCHLPADTRSELWELLESPSRAKVMQQLPEVGLVGTVRTRILAREVTARLARAAKMAATRPSSLVNARPSRPLSTGTEGPGRGQADGRR